MRIPTSVIVMSLLTAAPFGLAIRDTLNKKADTDEDLVGLSDYERHDARRDRQALAEYEAEAAREAEQASKAKLEKLQKLDTVIGKDKATLGSMFNGGQLGSTLLASAQAKIDQAIQEGYILTSIDQENGPISAVSIQITDNDYSDTNPCSMMRDKLAAAWGPSAGGTWLDPTRHVRARFSECTLAFDHYLDAADWISTIPFDLVGQPQSQAKLLAKVDGLSADVYDDQISWTIAGVGNGTTVTQVNAVVAAGKVVSITTHTDTDFDTTVAIRDAITAKLKQQPTHDEDEGAWVWKKKPGYMVTDGNSDNQFAVIVGKVSY